MRKKNGKVEKIYLTIIRRQASLRRLSEAVFYPAHRGSLSRVRAKRRKPETLDYESEQDWLRRTDGVTVR